MTPTLAAIAVAPTPPLAMTAAGSVPEPASGSGEQRPRRTPRTRRQQAAYTPEQRQQFLALVNTVAGKDAAAAIKVHWKDACHQTWDQVVNALSEGITVTMRCCTYEAPETRDGAPRGATRPAMNRYRTHRLHFAPDGSVALLDHPEIEVQDWMRSTEEVMNALSDGGYQTMDCLNVALSFPDRLPPLTPFPVPGNRNPLFALTFGAKLRVLHTLVAWAQEPDLLRNITPRQGQSALRWGITPAMLREYTDAGWTADKAIPWLQWRVDLPTATRWRDAGRSTKADAVRCAHGETPESGWTAVGLSASEAVRWQTIPGMTPSDAAQWQDLGFTPTQTQAFLSHNHNTGSMAPDFLANLAEARRWREANVEPRDILTWAHHAHRSPQMPRSLEEAMPWIDAGLTPTSCAAFTLNARGLTAPPSTVSAFIDLVHRIQTFHDFPDAPPHEWSVGSYAGRIFARGWDVARAWGTAQAALRRGANQYDVITDLMG